MFAPKQPATCVAASDMLDLFGNLAARRAKIRSDRGNSYGQPNSRHQDRRACGLPRLQRAVCLGDLPQIEALADPDLHRP